MTNLDSVLESRYHFVDKGRYSQCYGLSISHVQMWELDHKKTESQRIDAFKLVLEKILESPLDSKEIKSFNPKGYQLWIFIGRTDAEAEAPVLVPPDAKSQLIRKYPDA